MCGELRAENAGRSITVAGWAEPRRDHGGLVFVDLRDHTGKVQLVINPEHSAAAAETAHEIRNEFVLQATGEVVARAPELVNPNLPTGQIEVRVDELRILSRSTPLPFQLDEENVEETLRLRYRRLDIEMAFVEREDVLDVMEACVVGAFEAAGAEPPQRPFPHLTYADAMLRYGSDKPDLRFGLEIQDATEVTRSSEFGVFKNAPCVRYVVVPRTFSRSEQARLEEVAKEWGAKGLANLTQISKFLSERELEAFGVEEGSTALFVADEEAVAARVLGLLRLHLAHELDLIDASLDVFHWVTDFPLFEHSEEFGGWTFMHHPFTAAAPGEEERIEADPEHVRGQHYDLIWNGWELGSGSIRIHEAEVQQAVFRTMGLGEEEQRDKFGFLLDALAMGAPPHGGFAMGIDRFVARLAGEPDIRQMNAFPKVSSGSDPLTGAPTAYPDAALKELGIRLVEPPA